MYRYAYRVFYGGGRPSTRHPRLTEAEVVAALTRFQMDLPAYLAEDSRAIVSVGLSTRNAIHIVIITTLNTAKVDDAVDSCAKSHALNAISRRGA
jgi:hypothetical protein